MNARRDFDLLIAGGGMVGSGLAALMVTGEATRGLRVALIEPRPTVPPLPGEALDVRVSALSRAAERLLGAAGAWPLIAPREPCPYERMIIWDATAPVAGPDTLIFDAAEVGEANLGHVVENRAVTAALVERAIAAGCALIQSPVTGLELDLDVARVSLDGRVVTAGLVVAADGADSPLRHLAGLGGEPRPYRQEAFVAHLRAELPHGGAARQRFLPGGPLALLPLADGRVSLVWSTSPEQAATLAAGDNEAFAAAVTTASDGVLGRLTLTSARPRFPLRRFDAPSFRAPRLALVGDAAHSVHPLAGQGVNQGFLDALALAREIATALGRGEDPGDARVLGRYARARQAENALMGAALDGLFRVFTDERSLVRRGRRLGLGLVNRAGALKRLLIAHALGS